MFKKIVTLVIVVLVISPFFAPNNKTADTGTNSIPMNSVIVSELDNERATIMSNSFPDGGMEMWSDAHTPEYLSTSRTTEKDGWWEYSEVFEGSMAFGMHARAIDNLHYSEIYMTNQSQLYWDNPTNLTIDVEWYLDSIGNPVDQDYFRLQIRMDYRYLYYYIGCENTIAYNTSSYGYFMVDGSVQSWNHLHRNLTADYYDVFGEYPTQYRTMYWYIRSYTNEYTRIFLDDLWLVNGTTIKAGGSISHGNFEGGGSWTWVSGSGPGDIVQCSDAQEGNWSMNMTALTYMDDAYASAYYQPAKTLTVDNQGNLTFSWKLDDYVNPTTSTYVRMIVNMKNATYSFNFYYYFFIGGSGQAPMLVTGNDRNFYVSDFNVTGTWNQFDRNLWQDFSSGFTTENLWINQVTFQVRNMANNARLSFLVDDIVFTTSILSDMDYEHQNEVGENIQCWSAPPGNDKLTVTNFSASGNKAMNLTISDSSQLGTDQKVGAITIDETTELIFDFNMYIDTFNASSDDFALIQLEFNENLLIYVLTNGSSEWQSNYEGDELGVILLQDTVVTGEWLNFQRDIVHDYESAFGSIPDDMLWYLGIQAEVDASSRLSIIFDDMYIYYDTAPEITNIEQSPPTDVEAGELVTIDVDVTDASQVTCTFSYRVDSSIWTNVSMIEGMEGSFSTHFDAPWGEVEYFITAEDAFGKTDVAMDGSEYFTFTPSDTVDPEIYLLPANETTVSDIVSIEFDVTDSGSGFAWSQLFIAGAEITNTTVNEAGISWDTTVISNGDYNITVVAQDNAGNTASVTHFVTVQNTEGGTPDIPPALIIVVVIAVLGIVFVIYIFMRKKR
jgi:hypothetical protein